MAKRILVSDPISEKGVALLAEHPDLEVDVNTGLAPEKLLKIIGDYDGLIVRSQTKVTEEVFAKAKKLCVVGRAGVGVDNIDREAATQNGAVVMNTPSGNTISTAEHAFSLLISMARNIPQAHASVIAGKWERKAFQGVELNEKRLAVIGMGRIGTEFVKRAQAFGMQVTAYDPFLSEARAKQLKVELADSIEKALTGSQCITLHLPLTKETHHLINAERLKLVAPNCLLVNCARGGLIDETALAEAMETKQVAGAALDVYEVEPPDTKHPLFSQKKVTFTPHLGASTAEAQENVGIEVAAQVRDYLIDGSIRNAVNMPSLDSNTLQAVGPYLEIATAMGRLLARIGFQQPDALRVSYHGNIANADTALLTRRALTGYLEQARCDSQINLVNAPAIAKMMGLELVESTITADTEFSELIVAELRKGDKRFRVAATIIGKTPRIVEIDKLYIDMNISGNFLIVRNDDSPGVVAAISKTLAETNCNIANMSLARNKSKNDALTVIELDSTLCEEATEKLRNQSGIREATVFTL